MHDKSPEHLLMSESTARQDCRHLSSGLPKGELRLVRANEVSDVGFERLLARPHLALRQGDLHPPKSSLLFTEAETSL